jgi:hypothetical protein
MGALPPNPRCSPQGVRGELGLGLPAASVGNAGVTQCAGAFSRADEREHTFSNGLGSWQRLESRQQRDERKRQA